SACPVHPLGVIVAAISSSHIRPASARILARSRLTLCLTLIFCPLAIWLAVTPSAHTRLACARQVQYTFLFTHPPAQADASFSFIVLVPEDSRSSRCTL